ncbi:phage protein [Streptococcus gallolyticus]|uniref:Phage protein n=1 Tax=Streptococcus gallolyticus TaxID=315405 RepID=A0AA94S9G0_9STRE|nr:hypothetical protein [Streptococcus gallolyticus]AQP41527.1 hypothetical protein BTR42_02650 [Streptococcus gallolyticus subsp. gallolyticus DSM 16831]SQG78814.1 phage protein [Streptococcus gallolyticus]
MGSLATSYVDFLLRRKISELSNENRASLLASYHEQLDDPDLTIPYDQIAGVVYENENSDENNEVLNLNIELILSTYSGGCFDNLDKNLRKIQNNYTLAQVQKEYIIKNSEKARSLLQDLKPSLEKLLQQTEQFQVANTNLSNNLSTIENTIGETQKELDDVRDTKSSIYTDFIAILGVFSAFVFVLFGGIEIARVAFDIGDDLQTMDLSKMITISCLMLIGVLTLLYSLLLWIARITDKKIGHCMVEECENGCKHKWKHFYMRHSFYFTIVIFLTAITFISYVFF